MRFRLQEAELDTWVVEMTEGEFALETGADFDTPEKFLQYVASKKPPTISLVGDVQQISCFRIYDNAMRFLDVLNLLARPDTQITVDPIGEKNAD